MRIKININQGSLVDPTPNSPNQQIFRIVWQTVTRSTKQNEILGVKGLNPFNLY